MPVTSTQASSRFIPIALAVLALALYLPGIWWGAPHGTAPDRVHSWGVDDMTPLGALAEMHNIIEPKENRNLGYPLMHPFMATGAMAPYLGYMMVSGDMQGVAALYPFGMTDPARSLRVLAMICHLLSALLAVGIVLLAWDTGRTLWDDATGILTALFVGLQYPMFYYARTGNVDVPMLFFMAMALAIFARIMMEGFSTRYAIWLGIAVGFALATKEQALATLIAIPLVLLPMHWARVRRGEVPTQAAPLVHAQSVVPIGMRAGRSAAAYWRAPVLSVVVAFVAFGLGSGLFVDPERFFAHLEFASGRINDLSEGNVAFFGSYPNTLAGHVGLTMDMLKHVAEAITYPGVLLAAIGFVWTLRRHPKAAWFGLGALTYVIVLFLTARAVQLRYMMPVTYVACPFAGAAAVYAWRSARPLVRYAFAVVTVGVLGVCLLRGIDLTHGMIHDSRYAAAAWLAERTEEGDRIDYFGASQKLPPMEYGVVTELANEYEGAVYEPDVDLEARQRIRDRWAAQRPDFIVIMPDHSSPEGVEHAHSCPEPIFQDLLAGSLGYRLAARFETPRLLPWLVRPPLDYPTVNPPIRIFELVGNE
ncbi:MAG TPA: glycosyltransferase family 39 protein [Rhodothermales bacterium]